MQAEKIGIFWYYEQSLMIKAIALTEVKPVAGFVDYEVEHYKVWESLRFSNRMITDEEYDEVPRGRVIFNAKIRQFIVYTSTKLIADEVFKIHVLEQFCLSATSTVFKADEHYGFPNDAIW